MKNNNVNFEKTGLIEKNFILVVIGQIISLFGNAIIRFALPLYILDQSGSAALFGMVSAFSFLPMIIMSPIGGIIADRVNKQKIMVVLDFLTAAIIFGFILASGRINIVTLVIITMMILYGIQGAYNPSVQASIPLLLKEESIMQANAIVNLVSSFSGLLGPIIGGVLYSLYGLTPIATISCICFTFSAIMELFIKIPHIKRESKTSIFSIVKEDTKEGLEFIMKRKPILFKVMQIVFLFNIFFSSLMIIGLPVIIKQTLGISTELYGITQSVMAAGGLVGGILAGALANKINMEKAYQILLLCAICLLPIGLSLFLGAPAFVSYIIITIMSFFSMAFATIFSVQMLSYVQIETPVTIVGKVVSTLMAISMCAQPIGQSLYGILFENIINNQWIIIIVAVIISFCIAIFSKRIFNEFNTKQYQLIKSENK